MKKIWMSAFTLLVALSSCANNEGKIKITGKTEHFPDSTKVVLTNFETNRELDTAYIVDNKFTFSVSSSKPCPHGIFIGEGSRRELTAFFLEDTDVSLVGMKGEMKYAQVVGGEIQKQHSDYFNSTIGMELRLDSIVTELMKAMEEQDMGLVESLSQQQFKTIQDRFDSTSRYIKENPEKLYSAFQLKSLTPVLPKSEIKVMYEMFSPEIKESDYAQSVSKWLEMNKEVKVGDIAESFTLSDITGGQVSLKDFYGKFVLLEFWKMGCPGCVRENENILPEYKKYKEEGFEVISIAGGKNIDKLKEDSERFFVKWHSLLDSDVEDGNVATRYGISYVPANFLIDPTGRIIAKDLKGEALKDKLKEIFSR